MTVRTDSARRDAFYAFGLLVVIAALLALAAAGMSGRFSSTSQVTALMSDIGGGVRPGSDVKMRGVVVGQVSAIDGSPGHLSVLLTLDDSELAQLPSDVTARVLPATVFGTSFVDLVAPAGGSGTHLVAGDVIRQDTSGPTIELQQALDSIDKLVKALGPAQLSAVLHALAGSLDGRGSDIGTTIDRLNHLFSVLDPQIPLMREDARLLVVNMQTLEQIAPQLLEGLAATGSVARGLVLHADQARALLVAAIKLVDDGRSFLDATQVQFVRAVLLSAGVSQAVYDNRTGISAQARALDHLMTKILTATGGSPGPLRVNIELVNTAPYRYYTAADCPRYGQLAGSNCR